MSVEINIPAARMLNAENKMPRKYMQGGIKANPAIAANGTASAIVTFPEEFDNIPKVPMPSVGSTWVMVQVTAITRSGFTLTWRNLTGNAVAEGTAVYGAVWVAVDTEHVFGGGV
jgi:hypothetical protein